MEERLQKILAAAGIASRRRSEQLILEGRVTVNGKVITELGTKADFDTDHIKVDGKLLRETEEHIYLALHKPDSVMSTVHDPQQRTTVLDLLPGLRTRVYPVGRLDYHSQGLILLTNDGEFANAILAAKSHVPKTYLVKTKGSLTHEEEEQFRTGLPIGGIRTAPAGLRLVRKGDNPWYEVTLIEGRNQQIRLMFRHLGHLVEKLKRVSIGPIQLGSLKPKEFRFLSADEVSKLIRMAKTPVADPRTVVQKPRRRAVKPMPKKQTAGTPAAAKKSAPPKPAAHKRAENNQNDRGRKPSKKR